MDQISTQSIGIACGVGFLAYCIYFDHKRRNAPDYRDKVRASKYDLGKNNSTDLFVTS